MKKTKILSYRPSYIRKYGIGYAATALTLNMNSESLVSDIFSIQSEYSRESPHIREAFSKPIYKLLAKVCSVQTLSRLADKIFLKRMKHYDIAYLWPGCSLDVFTKLKQKQKKIVIECVNCHQQVAKNILDNESALLGGLSTHSITEADIDEEKAKLNMADFIFSPSPQVTASLLKMEVAQNKIIETSYGLDKTDLVTSRKQHISPDGSSPFTALFVGSVIPRKGIHLLLDYWKTAGVDGKLKVIGKIDPAAETIVSNYKNDDSIEFVSFTNDLASHYKKADMFIMPSLEEGSPLVTYLAIGAGLPCLVSPMAGEGVIRNDIEGYIIQPHDKEQWVATIKKLANDKVLRKKLADASSQRAEYFLWPEVAQRRAAELLNK